MKIRPTVKTVLAAATLAALSLGLSAAAQDDSKFDTAGSTSGRMCFRIDDVDGFAPVRFDQGVDGVNIRVRRDVYQMKFVGPCIAIRDATRIAVESRQGAYVCSGVDTEVLAVSRLTGAERCLVSGLRKVEPDEVASLPSKERP